MIFVLVQKKREEGTGSGSYFVFLYRAKHKQKTEFQWYNFTQRLSFFKPDEMWSLRGTSPLKLFLIYSRTSIITKLSAARDKFIISGFIEACSGYTRDFKLACYIGVHYIAVWLYLVIEYLYTCCMIVTLFYLYFMHCCKWYSQRWTYMVLLRKHMYLKSVSYRPRIYVQQSSVEGTELPQVSFPFPNSNIFS